jgi:hypothetical protein
MKKRRGGVAVTSVLLATLAMLSGCATIGPEKVPMDRANYNDSITESWKQQLLLNIVKIRYVEPLFFVDIGDIVAGYTMETGANVGFSRTFFDPLAMADSSKFDLGVSGKYTDRPTITYKPMSGAPFRKAVMSPMPLRNVVLSLESGVSANFLVNLGVRSINGLRNETLSPQGHLPAEKSFKRVVEIIAQLQRANAVHMRTEPTHKGGEANLWLALGGMRPSAEVTLLVRELRVLLDLDPPVSEYELVSAPNLRNKRQIVLQTYSLMQIMAYVSAHVDVPKEDVASQRAMPSLAVASEDGLLGAIAVRCTEPKPLQAFAAVKFHEHWFWVDDHDLATKRVFSFLMLAFTIMEDGRGATPLQMTIPVQ